MRGCHEGAIDEIQGKIKEQIKKSPEKFWRLKNKPYLCSRFRTRPNGGAKRLQGFASLAQLARARDL